MATEIATHARRSLARLLVCASVLAGWESAQAAHAATAPIDDLEAVIQPKAADPAFVLDETLATGITGLDVYTLACPAGTVKVVFGFQGLDVDSNPLVSIIVSGGRAGLATVADASTSRNAAGGVAAIDGGAGTYSMSITKGTVSSKPVFYTAYGHCEAADGTFLKMVGHLDIDR